MAGEIHSQIRTIALGVQAAEGTPEVLTASDADFFAQDVEFNPDIEQFERTPYKKTLGSEPSLIGPRKAGVNFGTELIGRGAASTPPVCDKHLRTMGFGRTDDLVSIPIGAVASGPFTIGETVSQATSGATGTVSAVVRNGDSFLFVHGVSGGTFDNTNQITGGTSGATATPSGAPDTSFIYMYRPASSGASIATLFVDEGSDETTKGLRHRISDAIGHAVIRLEDGNRAILSCEYMGKLVDSAAVDPILDSTRPTHNPPQWQQSDAARGHDSYPFWLESAEIDAGNEVVVPKNANDASGFGKTRITDRQVAANLSPILTEPTEHDFYNKVYANALDVLQFTVGDTAGNRFLIQLPRSQYTDPSEGERDSLTDLSLAVMGHETSGDDDLVIIAF